MKSADRPIFVIGCPRSGTTLVYSILTSADAFPRYEAESRILECSPRYGPLKYRRNLKEFLDDFLQSRQFSRSNLDPEELLSLARRDVRSYFDFLRTFMGEIANAQHKQRWVEKTPNNILYMEEIAEEFPDGKFLHVLRDGRDVAVSQRKLGWTRKYSGKPLLQLLWAGKIWEYLVTAARRKGGGLSGRYLEVRYEDLLTAPGDTLGKLSEFIEAAIPVNLLRTSDIGALGKSNSAFEPGETGVLKTGLGRWRKELEDTEIRVIEWALAETLTAFGYPLTEKWRWRDVPLMISSVSRFLKPAIHLKHLVNRWTPVGRFATKPLELGLR